jgi:hypothetical protein
VLYAGVAPAALFRTDDAGQTWSEVTTLTSHPTRPKWHLGAGGLCLQSIVDPENDERMFVGISAVGVFRSDDRGTSWEPANNGTRAEFMPDKFPEFGQCVHKLLMANSGSGVLFLVGKHRKTGCRKPTLSPVFRGCLQGRHGKGQFEAGWNLFWHQHRKTIWL